MTGRVLIDNVDIWEAYGVYVSEGGYNELLQWAPFKRISVVDWHEVDGVQPNLTNPKLDSRTFKLSLWGTSQGLNAVVDKLRAHAYSRISFGSLGRQYKVRVVGASEVQGFPELANVELSLADDYPLSGYNYTAPQRTITAINNSYKLDGTSFSEYDVVLLDGTALSFQRPADIKENLITNLSTQDGAVCDNSKLYKKSYTATLRCLMRATTLEALWRNYDALYWDMTRRGEHIIRLGAVGYAVYYEGMKVNRFYPDGKIWLEFDVNVNVFKGAGV